MIEIEDIREKKDFQGYTFSNFKKSEAKKAWIQSILQSKLEESCYWCTEFLCAGHFIEIWEVFFLIASKHIHIGNPKLSIYIYMRYNTFRNIIQSGYIDRELELRNNPEIRKLFSELTCVLALSNRNNAYTDVKLNKKDMNITEIHGKLKSPSIHYCKDILKKEDANELIICINEFCYHISISSMNSYDAMYWMEWLLEYTLVCKKKKDKCLAERRQNIPVHSDFQCDPIWIIWEAIQLEANKRLNKIQNKVIQNLFLLYCVRFSDGTKRKRKYMIYFAISLLTDYVDIALDHKPIIENTDNIQKILDHNEKIYKQIKANEKAPKTSYLFKNLKKKNLDTSMKKLKILESIGDIK